jgi:DNA polymerase-2
VIEQTGWLLDLYADDAASIEGDGVEADSVEADGVVVWFLTADGRRQRLTLSFPVTFYAAGPFARLRAAWQLLRTLPQPVQLARRQKADLFAGGLDVLAVTVSQPAHLATVFHTVRRQFPELDYYDADIPLWLRLAAAWSVFPLAYCQIVADDNGRIQQMTPRETPWQTKPTQPPLTIMRLEPDQPPSRATPTAVRVRCGATDNWIPLQPARLLLIQLQATLRRHDPDLLLTRWGDTWLFPHLLAAAQACGVVFNPNRDPARQPQQRPGRSYFTYGQVVYRGPQVHLYGRWHIDQQNSLMIGAYGLAGILEQARVTGLPVQEIARKSPGAGITARQIVTALQREVLVPYQKQQAEAFKSAPELLRADRGGLVYQPLIGRHQAVAELDFISMYPSIMVYGNISPERVGREGEPMGWAAEPEGLVPQALRPLLAKRVAIKEQLAQMNPQDCRYGVLAARAVALKWLLVVCFGYLGYKNTRFGRIESHEAVTAYGREALLRAKEAAEELGFRVLHLYVDALWVQQPGYRSPADFQPLQAAIEARTGLPIALEGVYRWVAFLPSRRDVRVPVANRYFGVFADGRVKLRGIEARRHDTPPWIRAVQEEVLHLLARQRSEAALAVCLPEIEALLQEEVAALTDGRLPWEALVVSQTLSREVGAYRTPSGAARAAAQMAAMGQAVRPGQRVRFLYVQGDAGVQAWDVPFRERPRVDVARYVVGLRRAMGTLFYPFGWDETAVFARLAGHGRQLPLPLRVHGRIDHQTEKLSGQK